MNHQQITTYLYKIGPLIGLIMLFFMLNNQEIYPNGYIWYAFLIHHVLFCYIHFVNGAAFGITQTIERITADQLQKEKENDRNLLN